MARCGLGRRHDLPRDRVGHRRLDPHPVLVLWCGGVQGAVRASARTAALQSRHLLPRRRHGSHGGRRCVAAQRDPGPALGRSRVLAGAAHPGRARRRPRAAHRTGRDPRRPAGRARGRGQHPGLRRRAEERRSRRGRGSRALLLPAPPRGGPGALRRGDGSLDRRGGRPRRPALHGLHPPVRRRGLGGLRPHRDVRRAGGRGHRAPRASDRFRRPRRAGLPDGRRARLRGGQRVPGRHRGRRPAGGAEHLRGPDPDLQRREPPPSPRCPVRPGHQRRADRACRSSPVPTTTSPPFASAQRPSASCSGPTRPGVPATPCP